MHNLNAWDAHRLPKFKMKPQMIPLALWNKKCKINGRHLKNEDYNKTWLSKLN